MLCSAFLLRLSASACPLRPVQVPAKKSQTVYNNCTNAILVWGLMHGLPCLSSQTLALYGQYYWAGQLVVAAKAMTGTLNLLMVAASMPRKGITRLCIAFTHLTD